MFRRTLKIRQHHSRYSEYRNRPRPDMRMYLRHQYNYRISTGKRWEQCQLSCHFTYLVDLSISPYKSCSIMLQSKPQDKSAATPYRRYRIISSILWRQERRARYSCFEQRRIRLARVRLLTCHESTANNMERRQRPTTTCCRTEPAPIQSYLMSVIAWAHAARTHQLRSSS
jgi:hypothetical protein